MMMLYFVESKR